MVRNAVIESLVGKVERLMDENDRLAAENRELSHGRERLAAENRELKRTVAGLEKRIGVLELENGLRGGGADSKRAQARVNRLMREIDRCIALMNR
ncbi:MAG TPA: hypothetical protein H9866_08450 [Candidatus Tidjanibacter gallistercoris]|nr:hypothetical protein [Candidatus Tidjanibacter gallistercoris]